MAFAAVAIRDLLKAALRHRPDRIILGEIRGGEAFDLSATPEHRPLGHALDDSREFRKAGPRALHELRPAERNGPSLLRRSRRTSAIH